jgi:cytochrome c553
MNLDADPWRAGIDYSSAPTCATCHMGAAGKMKPTHDVGLRSAWKLNSPVSEKQYLVIFENGDKLNLPVSEPAPKRGSTMTRIDGSEGKIKAVASPDRRRKAMSTVCLECHGKPFVTSFMKQFDRVVENYNEKFGKPAQAIMQALYKENKLTPAAFDEPLEMHYWELWHDEGAVARHGAAMASPNHAWWEGMYRVGRNFYHHFLPEVRKVAGEALAQQLIEEHVTRHESHQWLQQPDVSSPILGYGEGAE